MARWLIWTLFVVAWTVALEMPVPETGALPGGVSIKIAIAKGAHVLIYALMTALSAWVPVPVRYRWLMILFLMGHASGSELLQEALKPYCNRNGSLTDVGLDHLGIVLGAALSWKWWTRA